MGHKERILVVEDETSITNFISTVLAANNFDVLSAQNGSQALMLASSHCPDAIILDLGLPDIDGQRVIQSIREWSEVPILVVSARMHERDKVAALDLGADDYVTKPFSPAELTARVDALLRRTGDNTPAVRTGELYQPPFLLNMTNRTLEKNGERVKLTQLEYSIVKLFMENRGKALAREEILDAVWGKGYFGELKIVDVNVRRLRIKIEDDAQEPKYISTVWGFGYKWTV